MVVLAIADDVTSGVFAYQQRGFPQYSSCNSSAAVFAYECSTSRSSKFCTSGERGAWFELSLQGTQVGELLLVKLVAGPAWQGPEYPLVRNRRCV